jgi:hypothetical protein
VDRVQVVVDVDHHGDAVVSQDGDRVDDRRRRHSLEHHHVGVLRRGDLDELAVRVLTARHLLTLLRVNEYDLVARALQVQRRPDEAVVPAAGRVGRIHVHLH